MSLLIRILIKKGILLTSQYMHFYLVTLNIVLPIVCVEITTEIKTLLSAIFDFLFFPTQQRYSLIVNL